MNSVSTRPILVVDDDEAILKLLVMRLEANHYKVISASSGTEALTQLNLQQCSLVISDLRMPEIDGLALFNAVRQIDAAIPFILLTAHGSIADAVQATQEGVFSFLTKPFDSQELLDHVTRALSVSTPHADNLQENWRAEIISSSPQMEQLLNQAKLVAASDASVLISGESGTGKELIAKAIHAASLRRDAPFVAINCAALPEALLESELFGHAKGAFTGALKDHTGLMKNAEGGTLFLDEIGDMPLPLQAKLLRALQERTIRPLGTHRDIAIDVRLICATHKNLQAEIQENRFREDLYYRIHVVHLDIPRLSDRATDISLLANHFMQKFKQKYNKTVNGFAPEALEILLTAPWPGNVRQLQNIIEQVVVLTTTPIITAAQVQKALQHNIGSMVSFDVARKNFEHQYLINLLKATQGNVTQSARIAGRNRTEFYKILQRHQINPALFKVKTD